MTSPFTGVYVVSSPPSYHSDSSSNDDVDELWDMSPPGSPPTSLAAVRMGMLPIYALCGWEHCDIYVTLSILRRNRNTPDQDVRAEKREP